MLRFHFFSDRVITNSLREFLTEFLTSYIAKSAYRAGSKKAKKQMYKTRRGENRPFFMHCPDQKDNWDFCTNNPITLRMDFLVFTLNHCYRLKIRKFTDFFEVN